MKPGAVIAVALLAALARAGGPEVALAPAFGDHMVWPRDVPVPLWGTATPGAAIETRFAGQVRSTRADSNGAWRVVFDPQAAAAKPRAVEVSARAGGGTAARFLNDVVVGDVWLAAGQSNMKFPLKQATGGRAAALPAAAAPVRLLRFAEAATGDAGAYTDDQLARLEPARFFSGAWSDAAPNHAAEFSAVGWYFARRLAGELGDVPVGVIQVAVGGSPAEAWIGRDALAAGYPEFVRGNWLQNPLVGAWCRGRAGENLRDHAVVADDLGPAHPFKPGFLWAAGIAPLAPLPVRGVLWYQGESNAEEAGQVAVHERLFPLLVDSWRSAFGRELPFLFVQLPGLDRPHWPAFRASQRRLLDARPGLGMAVAIDLGERGNVHPPDKQPVGERLARLALAQVYGRGGLPTGPLAVRITASDAVCRVRFIHADGLATRDGTAPRGFELQGGDGDFHPVEARIEGDEVVLAGPGRSVRYGWQGFPAPPLNLVNRDDLPAAPFALGP